jgi:hypothetical protein
MVGPLPEGPKKEPYSKAVRFTGIALLGRGIEAARPPVFSSGVTCPTGTRAICARCWNEVELDG